jgi:hypothetical protein
VFQANRNTNSFQQTESLGTAILWVITQRILVIPTGFSGQLIIPILRVQVKPKDVTERLYRNVGKELPLIELLVREEAKVDATCRDRLAFGYAIKCSLSLRFVRANCIWTKLQVASANTKLFTYPVEEANVTNI